MIISRSYKYYLLSKVLKSSLLLLLPPYLLLTKFHLIPGKGDKSTYSTVTLTAHSKVKVHMNLFT